MKGENHNPLFPKIEDHSKKMPPQDRVVFDCKVDLAGLPDETYGVEVRNERKELMKEVTGDKPLEEQQFRVDYTHGYLYFHPVHNKKTVTIQKYYSRGMLYFPASRVYSIDEDGRVDINTTLQDYIDSIKSWIFQGDYRTQQSYTANNSVYSDGSIYIAKQDVPTNKIPKKNPEYWQPMSSGFVYRGEYDSSETYYPREIVAYKKGYYACLQEVGDSAPGSGTAWQEIVSVDSIYEAWQGTDGNGGLKQEIAETLERAENTRDEIVQEWEGTANSEGLKQQLESMLDGIIIEDNLTSTSTTSSLSAHQGKVLNDTKADKQTVGGGFVAGEGANTDSSIEWSSGGAIGKSAYANNGGAVGKNAQTSEGGAVGANAETNNGGAIGENAKATADGGAIGNDAETAGGAAIGYGANSTYGIAGGYAAKAANGGAVGNSAIVGDGGAIGQNAETSDGFAGGKDAVTKNGNNRIDAIQLGTGTNSTEKTLQIYDYQLLDADGNIPVERLANAPSGGSDKVKNGFVIGNSLYHTAADCDYLYDNTNGDISAIIQQIYSVIQSDFAKYKDCMYLYFLKGTYKLIGGRYSEPMGNFAIVGELDPVTGERLATIELTKQLHYTNGSDFILKDINIINVAGDNNYALALADCNKTIIENCHIRQQGYSGNIFPILISIEQYNGSSTVYREVYIRNNIIENNSQSCAFQLTSDSGLEVCIDAYIENNQILNSYVNYPCGVTGISRNLYNIYFRNNYCPTSAINIDCVAGSYLGVYWFIENCEVDNITASDPNGYCIKNNTLHSYSVNGETGNSNYTANRLCYLLNNIVLSDNVVTAFDSTYPGSENIIAYNVFKGQLKIYMPENGEKINPSAYTGTNVYGNICANMNS